MRQWYTGPPKMSGQADPSGHCPGKLLSPERRRTAVEHARQSGASERHACHLVHQPRGTQRYQPTQRNDEDALTRAIITLADRFGRYGYRRITIKLREAGWNVGKDRVERIWRREGLKVPQKQKPRGRLWLNDGFVRAAAPGASESRLVVRLQRAMLARRMR